MIRRTVILLLAAGCSLWSQPLAGVIDIHAHADPDGADRSIDALELARLAKERGMRGLVLKNHYEPTAAQAYLVRKMVPGIEIFGGISLDLTVGGVNPAAVEWMTKMDGGYGRVVWLPTFDSEHQVRSSAEPRPFAPVSKDGALLPATLEVIRLAARHNLMLETGHSSPAEALLIIAEAKRQGVRSVVVTHAMQRLVGMSIAEMKRAAELGAYLEFVWVRPGTPAAAETARAIREVGPEHCILSSDLGQAGNPLHPDGLAAFFEELKKHGLSQAEIDLMSKINPARALGLEP